MAARCCELDAKTVSDERIEWRTRVGERVDTVSLWWSDDTFSICYCKLHWSIVSTIIIVAKKKKKTERKE